ncbi:MAG: Bacterial regulatory protein Fis family, partial [Pseudomonadota bacterium]
SAINRSAPPPAGADEAGDPTTDLAALERSAIAQALAECGGRVSEAARRLGVHRSTVYRHLEQQRRMG